MTKPSLHASDLTGCRILVIEDLYLVADDICRALVRHGASVVGPTPDLATGLELARCEPIDAAVLDINLDGETSYQIADELAHRDVPFIFATGYEEWVLPVSYRATRRVGKPFSMGEVVTAIIDVMSDREVRAS